MLHRLRQDEQFRRGPLRAARVRGSRERLGARTLEVSCGRGAPDADTISGDSIVRCALAEQSTGLVQKIKDVDSETITVPRSNLPLRNVVGCWKTKGGCQDFATACLLDFERAVCVPLCFVRGFLLRTVSCDATGVRALSRRLQLFAHSVVGRLSRNRSAGQEGVHPRSEQVHQQERSRQVHWWSRGCVRATPRCASHRNLLTARVQ